MVTSPLSGTLGLQLHDLIEHVCCVPRTILSLKMLRLAHELSFPIIINHMPAYVSIFSYEIDALFMQMLSINSASDLTECVR